MTKKACGIRKCVYIHRYIDEVYTPYIFVARAIWQLFNSSGSLAYSHPTLT